MDPLDSNLILFEQCIYVSSIFGLPRVEKVLLKSDFEAIVEDRIKKKQGKNPINYRDSE